MGVFPTGSPANGKQEPPRPIAHRLLISLKHGSFIKLKYDSET